MTPFSSYHFYLFSSFIRMFLFSFFCYIKLFATTKSSPVKTMLPFSVNSTFEYLIVYISLKYTHLGIHMHLDLILNQSTR